MAGRRDGRTPGIYQAPALGACRGWTTRHCSHGKFGSPGAYLPSLAGGGDFRAHRTYPPTLLASVPPSMLYLSLGPV